MQIRFFTILLLASCISVFGQIKVGNDHEDIHPASLLELESKEQVMVLTKVSEQEMQAIVPLSGALVFNTTQGCIYFYHQVWIPLCEFTPEMLDHLWKALGSHQHPLIEHSHTEVDDHTHENTPAHTHETIDPGSHSHSEINALIEQLDSFTYEFSSQSLEVADHEHETPDHQHELIPHEHDYTTAGGSGVNSLSPQDSTNLKTLRSVSPGALLYANEAGEIAQIENASGSSLGMFWDASKARLGVGTTNPSNKMHVAGEIRSQGFSNSNGSQNEPSYSFKSDSNTGMYRAAADQLAFSTQGNEVMRLTKLGAVAIGKETANALLDVNGAIATPIRFVDQATATIEDLNSTVILGENCNEVLLPLASENNKGRRYIIKNATNKPILIQPNFVGSADITASQTQLPVGVIWLQSDGSNWQQIN